MPASDDPSPLDDNGLPAWFVSRQARSPVVLVAPHGGTRERTIRRTDGINDLHTADLALEIAQRLDARALINRG